MPAIARAVAPVHPLRPFEKWIRSTFRSQLCCPSWLPKQRGAGLLPTRFYNSGLRENEASSGGTAHYMYLHVLCLRRSFRFPPSLPFCAKGTRGSEAPFGRNFAARAGFRSKGVPACFRHTFRSQLCCPSWLPKQRGAGLLPTRFYNSGLRENEASSGGTAHYMKHSIIFSCGLGTPLVDS